MIDRSYDDLNKVYSIWVIVNHNKDKVLEIYNTTKKSYKRKQHIQIKDINKKNIIMSYLNRGETIRVRNEMWYI